MNSCSVKYLASQLRDSGDKILNQGHALSLTPAFLCDLTDAFSFVVEDSDDYPDSLFAVVKEVHCDDESIASDVQFLHDFVQKTPSLQIRRCDDDIIHTKKLFDISKFRNLKFLEISRVPVFLISGISSARKVLQSVICMRSIYMLEDIFCKCGGDNCVAEIWPELKEASFRFNSISELDSSLKYVSSLQFLDLSHNRVINAQEIKCLPNLKYLNLSFNLLEIFPLFHSNVSNTLKTLVIKNNYLKNLVGLDTLESLTELNVACNCLASHDILLPLTCLPNLSELSLEGNPLNFHSQHRLKTAKYLHNNIQSYKFVLDGTPLNKNERLVVGTNCSISPAQLSRQSTVSETAPSQFNNSLLEEAIVFPQEQSAVQRSRKKVRSRRPRDVIISEKSDNLKENNDEIQSASLSSLESSFEHLETKRQIESLRNRFGETDWLHRAGGLFVQEVLGLPRIVNSVATSPPLSCASQKDQFISLSPNGTVRSSPREEKASSYSSDNTPVQNIQSETVLKSFNVDTQEVEPSEPSRNSDSQSEQRDLEPHSEHSNEEELQEEDSEDEGDDEDEVEAQLFTVQRIYHHNGHKKELFLVVSSGYLKERDILTGKAKEKWEMNTLMSCMRIKTDPPTVQLTFDTLRQDRKEREYILEENDIQKLVRMLGDVLENRSLSAMNQCAYHCMKCSLIFAQEDKPKFAVCCPGCHSKVVIRMDEEPLPAAHKEINVPSPRASSPSQSSIGLAAEKIEEAQAADCSLLELPSTSSATSVKDAQVDCSAEKRYESDIEIISNPSQSSIEVLGTRSPSRKRSSEERQPILAKILEPIVQGLTESSSSDSLTGSVCTTYEHHSAELHSSSPLRNAIVPTSRQENRILEVSSEVEGDSEMSVKEKEVSKHDEENLYFPEGATTDFTSMLTGLLNNVSMKFSSNQSSQEEILPAKSRELTLPIEYSYTDFSSVDHRVKLFLYLKIFLDATEELNLLIRCETLLNHKTPFPSCVVLSTHRVYLLKVRATEGDDPDRWLSKVDSWPLSSIAQLSALPWMQGFLLDIQCSKSQTMLVCLLFDEVRTSNFLHFITDRGLLPDNCAIDEKPSSYVMHVEKLVQGSFQENNVADELISCSLFTSCTIKGKKGAVLGIGALLITPSKLAITKDELQWLFKATNVFPKIYHIQDMSNLLEVVVDNLTLYLSFPDDVSSQSDEWILQLATTNCVNSVIAAIKAPWEAIFSVPLQVTLKSCS